MTEKETEQNMLMEFIADTCYIDINKKIDYPSGMFKLWRKGFAIG